MGQMHDDMLVACVDLVNRAGASSFEIGWDCPHTPDVGDDHNCDQVRWHANATYRGARVIVDGRMSPVEAALALAQRLLSGAICRCRQPVTLTDTAPGCRWRLVGPRWEPGCDVQPIRMPAGSRGDHAALRQAVAGNRAQRRRRGKRGGAGRG